MSVPAAYVGIIVIWATTPLAIQWSGDAVGFMFGLTTRMAIGTALSLLLLALFRVRMPWSGAAVRSYAAAALGLYGSMVGVYWAAQYVPSGLISVLFGITPLITGLLAVPVLGERGLTPARLGGIVFGVAGLAVIFRADLSAYPQAWLGIGALLGAVSVYSLSMVLVKRCEAQLNALAQSTGGLLLALPGYLLTWWLLDGLAWPEQLPARSLAAIGYLAVFGSVLGFLLYYYALQRISTGALALITLITPVLALQLGQLANGEVVPTSVWLGTALVVSGLLLYLWGPWVARLLRRRPVAAQPGAQPAAGDRQRGDSEPASAGS